MSGHQPALIKDKYTDLLSPPIGADLEDDLCQKSCQGFSYRLVNEDFSPDNDEDMQVNDFFAYFPSFKLEQWTESDAYTSNSLLSDIGGALGLLLGSSIVSIMALAMQAVEAIVNWYGQHD